MDLELKDKVALVTGGSKGIGRAVALGLAAEGAEVAVVARDAAMLDKVAAECRDRSRKDAVGVSADLSQLSEVDRVVGEVKQRLGRVDILVNNAGAIRGGASCRSRTSSGSTTGTSSFWVTSACRARYFR